MKDLARLLARHLLHEVRSFNQLKALQHRGFSRSNAELPPENRLHSGIGYHAPAEFEALHTAAVTAA